MSDDCESLFCFLLCTKKFTSCSPSLRKTKAGTQGRNPETDCSRHYGGMLLIGLFLLRWSAAFLL